MTPPESNTPTATSTPDGTSVKLERGLSNRHLQLIAIGGAIGTGLFMGSGKMISVTGPAVLVIYMIIGLMIFLVMRALGELLLSNLNYKTFGDVAKDMVGPWAGFFVSWTYWFSWVVACVADLVAITGYVLWIDDSIQPWIPAACAGVFLLLLNLQPVKIFGEVEFWFALIKIVTILSLIVAGIALIIIGFNNPTTGTDASLDNIWNDGGLFPFGMTGFLLGFQMGIFSFIGVELVGTAAAETKNPRKNLPKAVNSIVLRILVFYIGALAVIMAITPWREIDPGESPFVTTLSIAGFGVAATAINLVVLTSAASSANSGVYSGTRMLFGLSLDNQASKVFSILNHRGVPTRSVFVTAVLLFSAVPLLLAGDTVIDAFTFVSSICSTFILFTWGMIVVSYIRYRKLHPERHAASKFKLPYSTVTPWLILAFFGFIIFTLIYSDETRVPALLTPIWFVILTIAWQLTRRRLVRMGLPLKEDVPMDDSDGE